MRPYSKVLTQSMTVFGGGRSPRLLDGRGLLEAGYCCSGLFQEMTGGLPPASGTANQLAVSPRNPKLSFHEGKVLYPKVLRLQEKDLGVAAPFIVIPAGF
jgi:hypothetical protein